jgi:hypothetical protein
LAEGSPPPTVSLDKGRTALEYLHLLLDGLTRGVRSVTPAPLRRIVREYRLRRWDAKHRERSVAEIFSAVYREGKWGKGPNGDLSSGPGSNDPVLVLPYVNSVVEFLTSLPRPPSVVDLGCGDFNVGRQLRPYCANYVACDVVPELIARNIQKFSYMNVDFRCIDIIEDNLPDGDVIFLRQVLQHLDNAQIQKIIPKLYRSKFLILTEHLPSGPDFRPNLDKPSGRDIRLSRRSGVVLTAAPFSLKIKSESIICMTNQPSAHPGLLRTTLYQLDSAIDLRRP